MTLALTLDMQFRLTAATTGSPRGRAVSSILEAHRSLHRDQHSVTARSFITALVAGTFRK